MTTSPRTSKVFGRPAFSSCRSGDGDGDAADGADVGGDVFADLAVAAGDAVGETRAAVLGGLVLQRDTEAVEFELGGVFDGEIAGQLVNAAIPVGELFFVVGVVEAEHGARSGGLC